MWWASSVFLRVCVAVRIFFSFLASDARWRHPCCCCFSLMPALRLLEPSVEGSDVCTAFVHNSFRNYGQECRYSFCSQCLSWYKIHRAEVLNRGSMDGLEEFGEPFDLYSYFWACGHLGVVKYRGQERYSFLRFSKENLHLKRLGITLLQAKEESWKSTHG